MSTQQPFRTVVLLFLLLSLALGGCALFGGGDSLPAVAQSPEELFWRANYDFMRGRYEEARQKLRLFVTQFPDNPAVPEARLGIARTYFEEENYGQARVEYERYLALHPRHERLDEALYFIGLSYFQQMEKVGRDQTATARAVVAFRKLLTEVPNTPYKPDAEVKIVIARRRLASQEIAIGVYYMNREKFNAAKGRFQVCLDRYRGTGLEPKALLHLGEAYAALEEPEKAETAYRQVMEQYPDSRWAAEAGDRLGVQVVVQAPSQDNKYPEESGGGIGGFFEETWDEIKSAFQNTLTSPSIE
ncbi:MAG: outer membrane protein assembly factor BamD [Candidatus Methylomirabilales bacterium]